MKTDIWSFEWYNGLDFQCINTTKDTRLIFSGLFFHVVGEGVVNLSKKAESVTDRESYIDFRLRLLGEQGKHFLKTKKVNLCYQ